MMTASSEARRAMAMTLAFDVIAAIVAMIVALFALWMTSGGLPANFIALSCVAGLTFGLAALIAFILTDVHRQVWRHLGAEDTVRILQAVALTVLIFLPVLLVWNGLVGLPHSSLFWATGVWIVLLFTGRMLALMRTTQRPLQFFRTAQRDAPKAVLVGDTVALAAVLKSLRSAPDGAKVNTLGLLQVDAAEPGRAIRGVPVLGDMGQLQYVLEILKARYNEVPWVAVTGEARSPVIMNQILEIVARMGSKVIALAPSDSAPELLDLRPADLLTRPERTLDVAPVTRLVAGSRVLVTGGGGTIGLELARQCLAQGPSRLVLLDASEYNLYRAEYLLKRDFPLAEIEPVLGDVRDAARLDQVMGEFQLEIVIHAAALKHVPLMERNVCEAILTNVDGAMNVTRAAIKFGAKRFVFISTDKAVDPDNVMGATKRLAEIAISRIAKAGALAPALVRFGNVLGSSGSVVPLFNEQIEAGGPVTVTHPDATRYFMTVEEAAALVLQAGAMMIDGERPGLFVLDMGEPIRIESLAEAMIRMRGKVPGVDIMIRHTGLRPGEKLCEELTHAFEDLSSTPVDGILKVDGVNGVDDSFDLMLASLIRAARRRERVKALELLGRLVPEYGQTLHLRMKEAAGA